MAEKPICSIADCSKTAVSHGWCGTHYARWRSTGDPTGLKPKGKRVPIAERFWQKVDKAAGCWEWQGGRNEDGYGTIGENGRCQLAHRIAWRLTFGEIPKGLCVCHRCDNPACQNPDHLFLGTHRQNMEDRSRKGRAVGPRGEMHHGSILHAFDIPTIREMIRSGVTQVEIARRYGVADSTIYGINSGKSWAYIP